MGKLSKRDKKMIEAVGRIARATNRTAFELVKTASHKLGYVPRNGSLFLHSLGGARYEVSVGNGMNWGTKTFISISGNPAYIDKVSWIISDAAWKRVPRKMKKLKGSKTGYFV